MTAQIEKREIGNLVVEGIPEIPKRINEKLFQYQNTREASLVDWTSDGQSILIVTRFGESPQFHLIEEPGGLREQLTFFGEPVFNGQVRPGLEEQGFLFSKDKGGDELYQLHYFDITHQTVQQLTDGTSKNGSGIWNKMGTAFVYTSTRRNQVDHDIYVVYFDGKERKEQLVLEASGLWYPIDWSPNEEWITVGNYRSVSDSQLYRLHLQSGQLFPLSEPPSGGVAQRGGLWSKDGKAIYFTSDLDSDFRRLYTYNIESQTSHLLSEDLDWNVESVCMNASGNLLALTVNENAYSKTFILDLETQTLEHVASIPEGIVEGIKWHPEQDAFAFGLNRPNAPADIFVWDHQAKALTQWTFSEVGGLDPSVFVAPTPIFYDSFDENGVGKRQIPAFYFRPKSKKEKYPVLIYIHGGPESQYRPIFSPTFQYYLNELEIAVVAPNVRGSTGYGKEYLSLDNGYLRENSVKDIGKLLDWIDQQPELDQERIAVIGGSYGGYMVLASMTHFNERLKCGIDIVGISNFITFLENTKSYRRALRRMEYGDERDPKMRLHLQKISPLTNAHKITKPLLIVQGMNDPRVPASEAEQMLRAIRSNGGEAWYLLAKDEGHGFRKKTNRDFYTQAVIVFLQQYLLE
ncbi:MAG: S9 family peptidase [Bacteroidota bacterium]